MMIWNRLFDISMLAYVLQSVLCASWESGHKRVENTRWSLNSRSSPRRGPIYLRVLPQCTACGQCTSRASAGHGEMDHFHARSGDAAASAGGGGVARMCLATLGLAHKMRDRKKKESGRR
jgi:5-methylcytosine-specific restriction endonuclease McrA